MMKEQFTTTVRVKGKGDAKARAFADALNHVQSAVMRESPYILLRIEPQDVRIVQAHESVRKEAFLFSFCAGNDALTAWSWM
ncbi:putative cytoplasmic protein [Salmonella enterica subsp. enterica serovar Heidelberg str. 75-3547]|uniref:Putative cytoplasmic protein n=1 Tax=Salmonella enterica subsp. enterica serovar Sanjuan TaxID=1160765 RepID=A0A3S4FMN6_SALET|nr:putative cytoplasmic protein [Salmonella enterica subsp. enterica serovar Heidelberg str. 622737-12]KJT83826.1 putative cytoplasmic protein [Salmonella enterica subsp. enterica serovar Heidelberg str. 75-3547]VEA09419.1 putative cytoplasmic protein [Salmonella enterica subsp. enterica serovar Sanjuan]